MEPLQPLPMQSFSFRWLIGVTTATDVEPPSFIDIDPACASLRWFHQYDFQTQTPTDASLIASLMDSEETMAFSGSPGYGTNDREGVWGFSDGFASGNASLQRKPAPKWQCFGGFASKKFFGYFKFLIPLYRKVKRYRVGPPGGDQGGDRRRVGKAAVADEYVEKSIHEAVLHCKKSIEKKES